jgi:hypothetical protein
VEHEPIMNGCRWLRRCFALGAALLTVATLPLCEPSAQAALPMLDARDMKTARQRLEENVAQLMQVLAARGGPLTEEDRARLKATAGLPDDDAIATIQEVLDRHALLMVHIDDEAWFKILPASSDPDSRRLVQGRWKTYLVKVNNEGRVTSPLEVRSPQAMMAAPNAGIATEMAPCGTTQPHDWSQWLLMNLVKQPPMPMNLSGREIEYFVLQLCGLEEGLRAAELVFYLGGGVVSRGHYADRSFLFRVEKHPAL